MTRARQPLRAWMSAFLGLLVGLAGVAMAATPADVTLDAGRLRGHPQADGSLLFRAIPYAAPPLGDLRWRPPQPVTPWTSPRDAGIAAPPCAQPALGWNDAMAARGSEDCLYLEVQTPALMPRTPAPVMVWIHGGANMAGAAEGYLPSALVREGVVLVTLQYRLGAFGFLSLPELQAGLPAQAAGNVAALDQIAALRWVRDNIARFGGDPRNVTIFGQSAGAQDVGLLMLSPLARGLFHRAIAQSGTAGFGLPPRTLAQQRALGERIAMRAGVATGSTRLQRLRALPASQLIAAAQGIDIATLDDDSYLWLQAVVDGEVLPDTPERLLAAHRQAPVPLLIGSNAQELELGGGEAGAIARLRRDHAASAQTLPAMLTAAPSPRDGSTSMRLATLLTFRCPALRIASDQHALGVPVWHYVFDHAEAGKTVAHSSELPFVFRALPLDARGSTLSRYWANFARSGNPNGPGLPAWPGFDAELHTQRFSAQGISSGRVADAALCAQLDRP